MPLKFYILDTSMVQPSAGDVPVAHSAAYVCVLIKGEPNKASRLLYLRIVFFIYFLLNYLKEYK